MPLTGDFDSCRRLSAQAAEIAEDWQDMSVRFTHFGQSVTLALLRDDPAELTPGWPDLVGGVRGFPRPRSAREPWSTKDPWPARWATSISAAAIPRPRCRTTRKGCGSTSSSAPARTSRGDGLALARALAATGDTSRAIELARTAAAEARRLDMPGLLRDADAFLADTAARARAADPLTPREREIADLVAQALSNRDVANKLVLSERTVESHVRNILAKTGLTTRTELTRWYLRGP